MASSALSKYVIGYERAQVWVLGVPPAPRKWLHASYARFGQICGGVAPGLVRAAPGMMSQRGVFRSIQVCHRLRASASLGARSAPSPQKMTLRIICLFWTNLRCGGFGAPSSGSGRPCEVESSGCTGGGLGDGLGGVA